ncbi:hypothetical protein GQ42DRAFT_165043 [Ramicandelaber brevisporus]|nr:hypothetical protein GQ42DRAFT_165043 [Ramicandelaber brevisporus]
MKIAVIVPFLLVAVGVVSAGKCKTTDRNDTIAYRKCLQTRKTNLMGGKTAKYKSLSPEGHARKMKSINDKLSIMA